MKTIQKILLGALLTGIVCLAGTRAVKAAVTFTYDEDSRTLSWTSSGTVDKIKIGTTPASVTGLTSKTFDTQDDFEDFFNTNLSLGDNTITAEALDGEGNSLGTNTFSIYSYQPEITIQPTSLPSHGSITAPTPGRGLKGETYSATWTQANNDNYALEKWSDDCTTKKNENLEFGTAYTITTKPISVAAVSPTVLSGTNPTVEQQVVVTLDPSTADVSKLTYEIDDPSNLVSTWDGNNSDTVKFKVSGSGTFNLKIKYNGTDLTTQEMTVNASVTDIKLDSYTINKGQTKLFALSTVPPGITVNCLTPGLPVEPPAGVETWGYSSATGTLNVTALADATGNIVFKFKAGNLTKDLAIQVVEPETVKSISLDGPDKILKNDTASYSSVVTLTNGKTSTQGVIWSATGHGTINSSGVLTATGNVGDKITVKVKAVADESFTKEKEVEIVSIIPVTGVSINHGITKGYKLDLGHDKGVVTFSPAGSIASVEKIEWTVASGNDYGSIDSTTKTVLTGKKKGTMTLTPKVYYKGGGDVTLANVEVKVYDPVVKTNDSSDTIKFDLPSAAFTANTASDNISSVTGYRVDVLNKDGDSVWNDHFSVDSLEGITLSTDKLNEFLRAASGNLSGETHKVKFRISPYSSGTYNTQYESSDVRVAYRTEEKTAYRGSDGKYSLSNSSNSSSKGSSAQASASGAGSGNAGGKLDKVPKTGEGNTRMLIIMIAMISATIAGAILLSYMPARANANKGIGGAEDVKGFFDSVSTTSTKDTKTEQTTADNADKDDKQS